MASSRKQTSIKLSFDGINAPSAAEKAIKIRCTLDNMSIWRCRECLAVVNTPVERARLYFRYHPTPDLLAVSDPERASHRAFGLREVGMDTVMAIRVHLPGELPEPIFIMAMNEFLNKQEGYEITDADQQMMASGPAQPVGQFLLDRAGIVRWSSTEVLKVGYTFKAANPEELMSAASEVAHQ